MPFLTETEKKVCPKCEKNWVYAVLLITPDRSIVASQPEKPFLMGTSYLTEFVVSIIIDDGTMLHQEKHVNVQILNSRLTVVISRLFRHPDAMLIQGIEKWKDRIAVSCLVDYKNDDTQLKNETISQEDHDPDQTEEKLCRNS